MTRIALLTPTRGRTEQFKRMVSSAHETSVTGDIEIFAALSEYDLSVYMPIKSTDTNFTIYPDGMPTVHKWNELARIVKEDKGIKLFMLAADDIIFETKGWDKALIDHYNALENKIHVYALRDSRDAGGTPHPICSREYIEAMGYFMPPIMLHWFCDTWTVAIAKSNNIFTHMQDFLLTHDKPSDRGQPDETHLKIRRNGWHDRDKYVAQTCDNFLQFEKDRLSKIIAEKNR